MTPRTLVARYEEWRSLITDPELLAQYDRELAALRAVPTDEDGRLSLPGPVPGDGGGGPPPEVRTRAPTDAALARCFAVEVEEAVRFGAIVPIGGGAEHDSRRKWSSLIGVWRSCGKRARLISDLRPANAEQPTPPWFALPSPADAAIWFEADWAGKVDISSGFWTMLLSDEAARAMSTVLPDGQPAEWRRMPFGWTWAPFYFDVALNPLVTLLRSTNPRCKFLKYVDDFLVLGSERAACAAALTELKARLADLGFVVAEHKSSPEPQRSLEFLGVAFDFIDHECAWPLRHAEAVKELAEKMLGGRSADLHDLRRFLGKTAFLTQLCPVMAVWRRALDDIVARHLAAPGAPRRAVQLDQEARVSLEWWARNALPLAERAFPWPTGGSFVVRCDASEWAGGVTIILPTGERRRTTLLLPPWLLGASSAAREFHVAVQALHVLQTIVGRGAIWRAAITVYTDSTASAGALRRGARAEPMRETGQRLLDFALRHGATVRSVWLPREELADEDAGSRRVRWADARLHPRLEADVWAWAWGAGVVPDLDAFASAANARAVRWLTMEDEPRAAGTDGLQAPWAPASRVWAYPPAALAARARSRAARECSANPSLSVVLVGPAEVVTTGAQRWRELPAAAVVLPPEYAGEAVQPPVRLAAALFGSASRV